MSKWREFWDWWFAPGREAAKEAARTSAYEACDKPVRCAHCAHDRFVASDVNLHYLKHALFDLGWLDKNGTSLFCANCGFMMLFLRPPKRIEEPTQG